MQIPFKATVVLVHGASLFSRSNLLEKWLPTLKKELGRNYQIILPKMPKPENPNCQEWLAKLSHVLEPITENSSLIGHSLGGSVSLQYIARSHKTMRNAFIVSAPFWCGKDNNWQDKSYALNKEEIKALQLISLTFYHGQNDDIVPHQHLKEYAEIFPLAKIRSYEGMNHIEPSELFLKDLASDVKLRSRQKE